MTPVSIKERFGLLLRLSPRAVKWIIAVVIIVVVAAVAVPVVIMSQSGYLGGLHGYATSYKTLQKSLHADLACSDCHVDQRGPVVYGLALTGEFYRSLFVKKTPVFIKMQKPINDACLKCHSTYWSYDAKRTMRIPHPAHQRVSVETRECVKCHKWTAHEEAYLDKHKTMPFSGVCVAFECHVGWKTPDTCESCHHSLQKVAGEWKKAHPKFVLTSGNGSCLEACHKVKQCQGCHVAEKSLASSEATAAAEQKQIEALHIRSDFLLTHGTWALPDQSKCLTCHVSEGECQNCHSRRPASHGPTDAWIGSHKNPAKDKRRCVTCHEKSWCDECHAQFKEMR